jgi:RHS repeat-associated protein
VRTIVNGTQNTLNWTLSDHLGSSSVTTTANGTWYSELRYSAFGETRYSSGITPTDYRYTGQLEQADVNLYYYNARWYDPELGRFIQADTIVPDPVSSKSYDRYSYVNNNPIRFSDPSGRAAVPFSVCQIAPALAAYCTSVYGVGVSTITVVFGGSQGYGNMRDPGPRIEDQLKIYTNIAPSVIEIQYPGYKYQGQGDYFDPAYRPEVGKSGMAINARSKIPYPDLPTRLICYSAGPEACIMYAEWRQEIGKPVSKIALLGGSYKTYDPLSGTSEIIEWEDKKATDGTIIQEGWRTRIEKLAANENGPDILIVTDSETKINNPPTGGNITVKEYDSFIHYSYFAGVDAMNTSLEIRNLVNDFLNGVPIP